MTFNRLVFKTASLVVYRSHTPFRDIVTVKIHTSTPKLRHTWIETSYCIILFF